MSEGAMSTEIPTTPPTAPVTPAAPATPEPAKPTFADIIPDSFKETPWVKDVSKSDDPFKSLFEMNDSAQRKLGAQTNAINIPGEGATPEELKAFHKALGVPDTVDGYENNVPDLSALPDSLKNFLTEKSKDTSYVDAMRKEAHTLGLTPTQWKGMKAIADKLAIDQAQSEYAAAEKAGEEQRQKFSEFYGDKADTVERNAKAIAEKVLPKEIRDMGDTNLALFHALNYIHEKGFSGDTVTTPSTAQGGLDLETVEKRIAENRKRPEYTDKFAKGYAELHKATDELYELKVELQKSKSTT